MSAIELAVLALAVWRLCYMLSIDDGPADVFRRLRIAVGCKKPVNMDWQADTFLGKLLLCPLCLSVWLAVIVYLLHPLPLAMPVLTIFALSGASCILQLLVRR